MVCLVVVLAAVLKVQVLAETENELFVVLLPYGR